MAKTDRLAMIAKLAKPANTAEPVFATKPADPAVLAKRGARTGWNPDPSMAGPVREWRPEPPKPAPATQPKAPRPRTAPRASDAALDRAKARALASTPAPAPPSGAVTGPRLRQGVGARSSMTPSRDALVAGAARVTATRQMNVPPPKPKLRPGVRPRSSMTPSAPALIAGAAPVKTSTVRTPAPRPVVNAAVSAKVRGGGRYGAVVGAGINALQAAWNDSKKKAK